jgi:hypothetical protein
MAGGELRGERNSPSELYIKVAETQICSGPICAFLQRSAAQALKAAHPAQFEKTRKSDPFLNPFIAGTLRRDAR